LDKAIALAKKDIVEHPKIYDFPIKHSRFNDSIYYVINLRPDIIPTVGSVELTGGGSLSDYKKMTGKTLKGEDGVKGFYNFYASEGNKTATFIGFISRIHGFINAKEKEKHFMGCRTVISSGYRKKYIDESGTEDYFSANFSLANAYLANKMGSQKGFSGNGLYVEDNVARIIGYDEECKNVLRFSKYIYSNELSDPYEYSYKLYGSSYLVSPRIEIELFKKKYIYRQLNSEVLSNFRLMPLLKELLNEKYIIDESFTKELLNCIKDPFTELIEFHSPTKMHLKYPVLFIHTSLDEDVEELEKEILKGVKELSKPGLQSLKTK